MTRVLVTGGTGFIGAFVTKALLEAGFAPRLFDFAPNEDNLSFVLGAKTQLPQIVRGDICDADAVANAMQGCEAVVHLAGLMTVDCAADPLRAIRVNLEGSQIVFDAATAAGVKHIAYASTAGVYGPSDEINPRPESLYGVLKLAVEGIARIAHLNAGLRSTGFRPYIVYGPGQSSGIAAGPSIALGAAARGQDATIRFSGTVGFVHVEDVARAIVAAITHNIDAAEVVDLTGDIAPMDRFTTLLNGFVPQSTIAVEGAPLRIPVHPRGGQRPDWFTDLDVTPLKDGIEATLRHWAAYLGTAEHEEAS